MSKLRNHSVVAIHLKTMSDTHFVITVEVYYSAFKILEPLHASS